MQVRIFFFLSILIGGCSLATNSPVNTQGMMAVDGITVATTGKTISDHFVSYTTGKNFLLFVDINWGMFPCH